MSGLVECTKPFPQTTLDSQSGFFTPNAGVSCLDYYKKAAFRPLRLNKWRSPNTVHMQRVSHSATNQISNHDLIDYIAAATTRTAPMLSPNTTPSPTNDLGTKISPFVAGGGISNVLGVGCSHEEGHTSQHPQHDLENKVHAPR